MPISFDPTVSGSDATSYITLVEADEFIRQTGKRLWDSWDLLSDDEKKLFLNNSAEYLDDLWEYQGNRSNVDQARSFPRGNLSVDGIGIKSTEIPRQVKKAQAIHAGEQNLDDQTEDNDQEGLKSFKMGPLAFTFNNQDGGDAEVFTSVVQDLLSLFGNERNSDNPVVGFVR